MRACRFELVKENALRHKPMRDPLLSAGGKRGEHRENEGGAHEKLLRMIGQSEAKGADGRRRQRREAPAEKQRVRLRKLLFRLTQ